MFKKKYRKRITVEARIQSVIARKLGVEPDKVTTSADLVDDLGADSLDRQEIRLNLEDEFEIEISDEELAHIKNLEQATDCVAKHLNL